MATSNWLFPEPRLVGRGLVDDAQRQVFCQRARIPGTQVGTIVFLARALVDGWLATDALANR